MRTTLILTILLTAPVALAGCLANASVTPAAADAADAVAVEHASFRLLADGAPRFARVDVPAGTTVRVETTEVDYDALMSLQEGCLVAAWAADGNAFDGAFFLRPHAPLQVFTISPGDASFRAGDAGVAVAWQCGEDAPVRVHFGNGSGERVLEGVVDARVRHESLPLEGSVDGVEPAARVVSLEADREITSVPAVGAFMSGAFYRDSASVGATLVNDWGVHARGETPDPFPFPWPEWHVSVNGWSANAGYTWNVDLAPGDHAWYRLERATAGPEHAQYAFQVVVLPVIE